jgi:hypothetical protein
MGGNAQVILDYDCPDDKVYFISPDSFTIGELKPLDWERGTEGILTRIPGTLDFEAVMTWFGNIACKVRAANAVLANRTA